MYLQLPSFIPPAWTSITHSKFVYLTATLSISVDVPKASPNLLTQNSINIFLKPVSPIVFPNSVNDSSIFLVAQGEILLPLSNPPTHRFNPVATTSSSAGMAEPTQIAGLLST